MLPTMQISSSELKNGQFVALVVLTWLLFYSAKLTESTKEELTCFTGHTYPLAVIEFERKHKDKEFESEKERFKMASTTVGKETCCVTIFAKKATYNNVPILILGQAPCAVNQSSTGCDYLAVDNWKMSDEGEETTSLLNVSKCQCTVNKCNKISGLRQGLDNAISYTIERWKKEEAKGCWRSRSIPHKVEKEQPWCVNYYKLGNTHPYPKWDGNTEEKCRRNAAKTNASSFCFAEEEEEWFCCCKRPFCNKINEQADMDPQVAMSRRATTIKTTTTTRTATARTATSPPPPPTPSRTEEYSEESCFEKAACLSLLVAGVAVALYILLLLVLLLFCCIINWRRNRKKKKKMRLSETQSSSLRPPAAPRRGLSAKKTTEEEKQEALEETKESDSSSTEESEQVKEPRSPSLKNETQKSSSSSNSTEELSGEEEENSGRRSLSTEAEQRDKDVVVDSEQVDRGIGSSGADGGGGDDGANDDDDDSDTQTTLQFVLHSPPPEDTAAKDEEDEGRRRKDVLSPLSSSLT